MTDHKEKDKASKEQRAVNRRVQLRQQQKALDIQRTRAESHLNQALVYLKLYQETRDELAKMREIVEEFRRDNPRLE